MSQASRRTTHTPSHLARFSGRPRSRLALAGLFAVLPVALCGCAETDSFLDQSVVGRWEHTPTIMPVLDRIAAIEDSTGEAVEYTDPTPDDLIPLALQYRIGPGDMVDIIAYDIVEPGKPELYEVIVDSRGGIDVPQLGHFNAQDLTAEELQAQIGKAMERLVPNPLVSVQVKQQRQQTFTLIGSVSTPGPFFIPKPDYRLLEAITAGGPFNQDVEYVYVIRQVPLSEAVSGQRPSVGPRPSQPDHTEKTPPNILDIIKDLAPESKPQAEPAPVPQPAPDNKAPETKPEPDKGVLDLIDQIAPEKPKGEPTPPPAPKTDPTSTPAPKPGGGAPGAFASASQPPADAPAPPPAVDLPRSRPAAQPAPGLPATETPSTSWVFLNGKWVQVSRAARPQAGTPSGTTADELVTQRVIRVPMKDLIQGRQSVNIVVRPGDVVRIPFPPTGLVYMAGQVARVGPISIPSDGLTLMRAIDSAGGLSGLAIPERVDLQRMIGHDRQATIRLNLRAIAEQTQPEIRLKPSDRINVGTNFWAYPIAVVRNGMRASYGFGFLLDRNFGNDVFGVPPGSVGSQ